MSANYEREYQEYLKKNPHIAVMIRDRVRKYGDKTALKDKTTGTWVSTSWKEFGLRIDGTAKALLEMGVKEHEMVGILSPNTASWSIADAAILSIRGVSVPVYATNSGKDAEYIVNAGEIRIRFVFAQGQYDACKELLRDSRFLKTIIAFDRNVKINGPESFILRFFH
jgi:long-chain acyl-CoA synthetase